jgi:hypothetical protein
MPTLLPNNITKKEGNDELCKLSLLTRVTFSTRDKSPTNSNRLHVQN